MTILKKKNCQNHKWRNYKPYIQGFYSMWLTLSISHSDQSTVNGSEICEARKKIILLLKQLSITQKYFVAKWCKFFYFQYNFNATLIQGRQDHIQTIIIFHLYMNDFAKYFCVDHVKNTKMIQNWIIKYFY